MRLFCFSDTHQKSFPTCTPEPDAWLFAGDLYDRPSRSEMTQTDIFFRNSVRGWKEKQTQPIYAVRGNHDVNDKAGFFSDCEEMSEGAVRSLGGDLWLAGLGWAGNQFYELPSETDLRMRCDVITNWMPSGARCILLTHYPPHDPTLFPPMLDFQGFYFQCVTELIRTLKPLVVIAGHMHDQFGTIAKMSDSTILFPGPKGKLLTLDSASMTIS